MDPHALSVGVRWLHVAAMAVALGGAVLLAVASRSRDRPLDLLGVAVIYERAFWVAAGLLVMTGVGNVAAFGIQLPAPASDWGTAFVAKLLLIGALVLFSIPRTVTIAQLANVPAADRSGTVAALYATTAIALLAVLAVAVRLAHG